MEAFKIRHIPTGLFWQPHKHRGSTLSKTGKIYSKRNFAEAAIKHTHIQVAENSVVYRMTKDILKYQELKWVVGQMKAISYKSEWEIITV